MPLDTHAAFRELENSGFDAKQAEALVHVINGATGEQATKADVTELRDDVKADSKEFREEIKADSKELREEFKEFREEIKADFKELREEFKELREEIKAALKEQADDFKAALKEQREDFKQEFATKADLRAEVATATNRSVLGSLAVAALLFAALQLFS